MNYFNACDVNPETEDLEVNKHTLTEQVAYVLYGVYHIIVVAIMLNMLIAMMSNTLSRIQVSYLHQNVKGRAT